MVARMTVMWGSLHKPFTASAMTCWGKIVASVTQQYMPRVMIFTSASCLLHIPPFSQAWGIHLQGLYNNVYISIMPAIYLLFCRHEEATIHILFPFFFSITIFRYVNLHNFLNLPSHLFCNAHKSMWKDRELNSIELSTIIAHLRRIHLKQYVHTFI